jgi:hypothetical protein
MVNHLASATTKVASLAQWHISSRRTLRKAIATVLAVTFLFPTLSWSFDIQTFAAGTASPSPEIILGGPGSESLAGEYQVPANLGKMVEASLAPGDLTFILVQDLHCHAEVQGNIRGLLNRLMARHPEIRLVAVEGGSGIIPTMELAAIPDSLPKRAVADYFLREGKLTGADYLAICDRPQVEIYGAENAGLYNQSLALVQQFATEENRGIILEFHEQLDLLKAQQYHPPLLALDRQRQSYLKGEMPVADYYHSLRQEAKRLNLTVPDVQGRSDYSQVEAQLAALENKLFSSLLQTQQERTLNRYQKFIELTERIVNVSASHQDVLDYQAQSPTLNLAQILKTFNNSLGDQAVGKMEEVSQLEAAVQKSLQFYQLAEARNTALFKNAVQRAKERGEHKLVLITGGYHTQSIAGLIHSQGYSYITLRPTMTRPDNSSAYFDLLRNPQQPTELERILAQAPTAATAHAIPQQGDVRLAQASRAVKSDAGTPRSSISVMNSVVFPAFRTAFRSGIAMATNAMNRLQRPGFLSAAKYVHYRFNGEDFYATFYQRKFYLGRSLAALRWQTGSSDFSENQAVEVLRRTPTRILGLMLGGVGLAALPAALATSVAVAPALVLTGLGLGLATLWGGVNLNPVMTRIVTKTNIILSAVMIGVLLSSIFGGVGFAELFTRIASGSLTSVSLLNGFSSVLHSMVAAAPNFIQHLTPALHGSGSFSLGMATNTGMLGNGLVGPLFLTVTLATMMFVTMHKMSQQQPQFAFATAGGGMQMAAENEQPADDLLGGRATVYNMSGSDRIAQRSPGILYGSTLIQRVFNKQMKVAEKKEKELHGEPIADLNAPGPGVTVIVNSDDIAKEGDKLISNGLENFEAQAAIQSFQKEIDPFKDERIPTVDNTQAVEESVEDSDRFEAELEINVTHAKFPSEDPKYLQGYAKRVLASLDPAELIKGIQKDIAEYVARAVNPENKKFIGNLLASVAIAWRSKTAPKDLDTLHEVLTGVIGHEYSHGLILALPAGDIPAAQKAEYEQITFEKYQELLKEEKGLHSSVAMFKNVYKAVKAVRHREPSNQTNDDITRIVADETFNDRFAIYLDENHRKNILYRQYLGIWAAKDKEWMEKDKANKDKDKVKGHYQFADFSKVDEAEVARQKGQLGAWLRSQVIVGADGKTSPVVISDAQLADLEKALAKTESAHFFIAKYGDPQLSARERTFYFTYLRVLRHFDSEGTINTFSRKHVESSDPVKMVQTQLISNAHWDAETMVQETVAKLPGVANASLAVMAGENILHPGAKVTAYSDTDAEGVTSVAPEAAPEVADEVDPLLAFLDSTASADGMVASAKTALTVHATGITDAHWEGQAGLETGTEDLAQLTALLDDTATTFTTAKVSEETARTYVTTAHWGADSAVVSSQATVNTTSQQAASTLNNQATASTVTETGTLNHTQYGNGTRPESADNRMNPAPGTPPKHGFDPALLKFSNVMLGANGQAVQNAETALATEGRAVQLALMAREIGKAMDNTPGGGGAGSPITFGFSDPVIAKALMDILREFSEMDTEWQAIAGRVKAVDLPIDQQTGAINVPTGVVPVISDLAPHQNPTELIVTPTGVLRSQNFTALSSQAVAQYKLENSDLWNKLQAAHNLAVGQLQGPETFSGKYLLPSEEILRASGLFELIGNILETDLRGYARINEQNDLARFAANLPSLMAGHFNAQTREIRLLVNEAALTTLRQARVASKDVVVFNQAANVVQATSVMQGNLESLALDKFFGIDGGVSTRAVEFNTMDDEMVTAKITDAAWEKLKVDDVREKLTAILKSSPKVQALSDAELKQLMDYLSSLDTVTVISSDLNSVLSRMHAKEIETESQSYAARSRRVLRPVLPITEWHPAVAPSKMNDMKTSRKFFSSLLLGVAAGVLLLKALVEIWKGAKGHRLQLINYFKYPTFLRALQLISQITQGRADQAVKEMPVYLQQQVLDLQKAGPEAMSMNPAEAASLRYSIKDFQNFINQTLLTHPIFRFFMRGFVPQGETLDAQHLSDLFPELFMMLMQSNSMQDVVYYMAPAFAINNQINKMREAMDPALQQVLGADLDTLRTELASLRSQVRTEQALAAPDASKVRTLQSKIAGHQFAVSLKVSLEKLAASPDDKNLRRVAKNLIHQLGRTDVSEAYTTDILKILSFITPFQQNPVQIRLGTGTVLQTSLPNLVINSILRNQILNFIDVFDQNGQPLKEVPRELRFGSMA